MRTTHTKLKPQSVQGKKAVTILKCFLCNQLFYAQNTFDTHMKSHQTKLNRKIPQSIQSKTLDSFRENKDKNKTTLKPLQKTTSKIEIQNQRPFSKKSQILKQVQTVNLSKTQIEFYQVQSQNKQSDELSQIDSIMFESNNLLNQLSFLTGIENQQRQQKNQKPSEQSSQTVKIAIIKSIDEQTLYNLYSKKNSKWTQKILQTNFKDYQLAAYQQQLQYIDDLWQQQLSTDSDFPQKYIDIKNKLYDSVGERLKQKYQTQQIKKNQQKAQNQILYCCQCYDQISINDVLSFPCGHIYHKSCFQGQNCC